MHKLGVYIKRSLGKYGGLPSIFFLLLFEIYLLLFKNLSGALGIVTRIFFVKILFGKSGSGSVILDGVSMRGIRKFYFGKGVRIDSMALLDAYFESSGIHFSDNVEIHKNVNIYTGFGSKAEVRIGSNSKIGPNSCIYGNGGVQIGANVLIAANAVITASNHNFSDISIPINAQGFTAEGIVIGDNVWIGANCVIQDGISIGQGSIIGSGSVVTKNIPDYSIAFGSPARVQKIRS